MGLFKKKKQCNTTELKCPVEGCSFVCKDPEMLKRHMDWKHQESTQSVKKDYATKR